jgi:hypothetical protein
MATKIPDSVLAAMIRAAGDVTCAAIAKAPTFDDAQAFIPVGIKAAMTALVESLKKPT